MASDWLRDHTRDRKKFNILFDELVTYGFRRNLLGLKPTSLIMNAVVVAVSSLVLYYMPAYFAEIHYIEQKLYVVLLVVALHSTYMLLAVGRNAVREASISYGRQQILSCGPLMESSTTPRPRSPRK
jgi:hypothetical protein